MTEKLLMCTPEGFAVNYEINPWMHDQIGHVSPDSATSQWQQLFNKLSVLAEISLIKGDPAWPDLVFYGKRRFAAARKQANHPVQFQTSTAPG
ncbi:MAG: hypothetical protein IPJ38_00145 [Dechloromonas sp.]|uniref:Uncharacterized protein n=1 Tax=Candidatus Dechloromonas phosphorivorans TaxID=2899244 RepID=A0A935MPK3_9RHOO|nr:hypothetical protein [Candidatus Dechloromonas phosphorivorans]